MGYAFEYITRCPGCEGGDHCGLDKFISDATKASDENTLRSTASSNQIEIVVIQQDGFSGYCTVIGYVDLSGYVIITTV